MPVQHRPSGDGRSYGVQTLVLNALWLGSNTQYQWMLTEEMPHRDHWHMPHFECLAHMGVLVGCGVDRRNWQFPWPPEAHFCNLGVICWSWDPR